MNKEQIIEKFDSLRYALDDGEILFLRLAEVYREKGNQVFMVHCFGAIKDIRRAIESVAYFEPGDLVDIEEMNI